MPRFSDDQRQQFIANSVGKTIREVAWVPEAWRAPGYWVFHFTDGGELSVRLMVELDHDDDTDAHDDEVARWRDDG